VVFTVLRWAVLVAAVAPYVYYLVVVYCAWQFFSKRQETHDSFAPPVSILKPVLGLDPEAYENFASFCRQDYPRYEILFAVANEQDPAIPVIRKVIADFSHVPTRLLIGSDELGSNDKVNKLCRLAREARYDLLVISDSDIRVGPRYLASVVSPFADPQVGVVTCMYRGLAGNNLWSDLEAINLTSSFLGGVLVARQMEGVRFSLGATIAIPRERLAAIGGFEALVDFAADDFEVGHRIAAQGYRVELSPYTVETASTSRTAKEFLKHQMRWAIGLRHSRPGGYVGWGLTQGLPWSLAAAAASHSSRLAAGYLGAYLLLRLAMAWSVGVWGLRDQLLKKELWLLPLSDGLGFLIWVLGMVCNRIDWRGKEFYIRKGRLVVIAPQREGALEIET
jgi:ceramide glucosyltransferase